jgi:uncharacterized protein
LSADARECAALTKRLVIPAVYSLTAELQVKPWRGGGLKVTGQLKADLDQESVVSLEVFRSTVTYPVERYFLNVPPSADLESDEDIDPIEQGIVDLGEVVAETLALELDPYPRKPGEAFTSVETEDVLEEPKKPNPFNVLKLVPKPK